MKDKNTPYNNSELIALNAAERRTLQGGSTDPVDTDRQNFIRMMDQILREQ